MLFKNPFKLRRKIGVKYFLTSEHLLQVCKYLYLKIKIVMDHKCSNIKQANEKKIIFFQHQLFKDMYAHFLYKIDFLCLKLLIMPFYT